MNGFRNRYENTESILECIEMIVENIIQNEPLQFLDSGLSSPWPLRSESLLSTQISDSRAANTWAELLKGDPHRYLRISLTVEFSLSYGKIPSENDFPKALRMLQRNDSRLADYHALTDLDDGVFYNLLERALEAGQGA